MPPFTIVLMNGNSKKKIPNTPPQRKNQATTKTLNPLLKPVAPLAISHLKKKKEPLENYIHVKENIGSIIERVKLPQEDRKFMPPRNKKPALNDSLIAALAKWEQQNMPE